MSQEIKLYENIDSMDASRSDHILYVDGDMKAQLATGCELLKIDYDKQSEKVRLVLRQSFPGAPTEWPVNTVITLTYDEAVIEPNPIDSPEDRLEDVKEISSFAIITEHIKEDKNHKHLIELVSDDGIWDLYFNSASADVVSPEGEALVSADS